LVGNKELEVPPIRIHNISMLSKKEIDKLEIGDAVSYDGDDYMVIGKFEEGYVEVIPYPERSYSIAHKHLDHELGPAVYNFPNKV
jgi:hypothetical protein